MPMKKNAMDNWIQAFGNNLFDDSDQKTDNNQLSNSAVNSKNTKASSKPDTLKKKGDS
ncbi:hypothetical protein HMPREF1982_00477 [Clostridiales bacterium oral taxon 876 str. F0540]|nr:hypothetical protein HMPREF1982_00477 [Clostridiales bacterium oral taxon 876 str. F0540]